MRHQRRSKRFGRNASHLKAMLRNMAASLFRHERIVTTPQKAKECRRFAERLVTIAKKGGQANFRRALALLGDREMVYKLFQEVAQRFATRQGGYTRILHLADRRVGDSARLCIFELTEDLAAAKKKESRKKAAKPHAGKKAPAKGAGKRTDKAEGAGGK
jgi:large subunit ribosomal protein L17